jgi:hypothetical protein
MNRPLFQVPEIIRAHGDSFVERNRSWLTWLHLCVFFASEHILRKAQCRTVALSGHLGSLSPERR